MGPGERTYYLKDYLDEVIPCDPTLEGWAVWLSKPDPDFCRFAPTRDGARFAATVLLWQPDIIAERKAGVWAFSRDPAGADFMAVRFGEGTGWDADSIVWGEDMGQALGDWFEENDCACEDREYIAVGTNEPDVVLVYRADPPRLIVEGAAQ